MVESRRPTLSRQLILSGESLLSLNGALVLLGSIGLVLLRYWARSL
jgi:hypothetical protein